MFPVMMKPSASPNRRHPPLDPVDKLRNAELLEQTIVSVFFCQGLDSYTLTPVVPGEACLWG